MTLLKKMALKAYSDVDDYNQSLVEIPMVNWIPSQLPMNYNAGRFILPCNTKFNGGTFKGITGTETNGLMVFDFDSSINKYRITKFEEFSSYWDFVIGRSSTCFAFVDNTTILGISKLGVSTNTDVERCKINVASDGDITFTTPYSIAGSDASVNSSMTLPYYGIQGYDGTIYYGCYSAGNPAITSNGYLNKATATTLSIMSGSINTGLPSSSYQGEPGAGIALLGWTTPNGYLIVNASREDAYTYCRYKLINATGTPTLGSGSVSYTGTLTVQTLIPISATRVLAAECTSSSFDYGRVSLLYTNSSTTPTSITQGATATFPSIPNGQAFTASDVDSQWFSFYKHASNYKAKENKILTLACFKLFSASELAGGLTYYEVNVPCIIEAISNTSISISFPAYDINGEPSTIIHTPDVMSPDNAARNIFIVGAPDNKATIFYVDSNKHLQQQTFQL